MARAIEVSPRGEFIVAAPEFAKASVERGRLNEVGASLAVLAIFALLPTAASAQSAAPGATVDLPAIVVTTPQTPQAKPKKKVAKKSSGAGQASQASQSAEPAASGDFSESDASGGELTASEQATEKLTAIAGGTDVVARQDMPVGVNTSLQQALAYVPGVVVQSFFGSNDQPRLQILRLGASAKSVGARHARASGWFAHQSR